VSAAPPGWGRFGALCTVQTLSMTGGGATSFAQGVSVFQST
jgi:hypothetical protein